MDVFETNNFYSGDFTTDRSLFVSTLHGTYEHAALVISPVVEFSYLREEQHRFTVSDGIDVVPVAGLTSELGVLSLATEFAWPVTTQIGFAAMYSRPKFAWNFMTDGYGDGLEKYSGSLEVGLRSAEDSRWLGSIAVRYDGLGQENLEAVSVRATLSTMF